MVDMREYSAKVHRSLLQRDLMLGIPTMGLVLLLIMSVVFLYLLKLWPVLIVIVGLYCLMRAWTSKDPWMIDNMIYNVMQKDVFIP